MVVRFEVDACLPVSQISTISPGNSTAEVSLSDQLSNLFVTSSTWTPTSAAASTAGYPLVTIGGKEVPQETIMEMKTSAKGKMRWTEAYPQLFLSQTPHIFIATHTNGVVTEVVEKELGSLEMANMGKAFQPNFWRLKLALEAVQELAVLHGKDAKLSLVCHNGELKVYERRNQDGCLPDEVMSRFDA